MKHHTLLVLEHLTTHPQNAWIGSEDCFLPQYDSVFQLRVDIYHTHHDMITARPSSVDGVMSYPDDVTVVLSRAWRDQITGRPQERWISAAQREERGVRVWRNT